MLSVINLKEVDGVNIYKNTHELLDSQPSLKDWKPSVQELATYS